LIFSTDDEVLTDACWALSYLSDGPNERIQAIIETGISRRLVELLLHTSFSVQTPALRAVGNIVTGDDIQTQIMINASVLPCLLALLSSPKKGIRKEACWTISNITAGNRAQIQAVIDAQIIPRLISLLGTSDFDIKKEAAWALSNATSGGSADQIRYLVDCHIIEPLCDLLSAPDNRIILVALEGLENILKVGEKEAKDTGINEYAALVEECSGIDKLEQLQNHQHNEIYEKAVNILELYFAAEEEEQSILPQVNPGTGTYSFGSNLGSGFNF
jgi:importin subunit alpha-1